MLLLRATFASLVATIACAFLTRLSLAEAERSVTLSCDVKLAIDDCELALVRGDARALAAAEARVEALAADDLRQEGHVGRAVPLARQRSGAALEELLASMQQDEDRLMAERAERMVRLRKRGARALIAGMALALASALGALAFARGQRQQLARERALLEAIIDGVDEGIVALDPAGEVIAMNAVARSMCGLPAPCGRQPDDWRAAIRTTYEDGSLMHPHDGPLARALRGESSEGVVFRISRASDPRDPGAWVCASARAIPDGLGRMIAAVSTLRDITEQRAEAERLRDVSMADELTGLLNRRGFLAIASARIAEARRTRASVALLYADVNGLKRINDTLGHEQGDRAIEDAARVLRSVFRTGDVVARIGGDEFVALLPDLGTAAREPLLERLAAAIRANERQGRPFHLSMSYGVTFMDWDAGHTLGDLLADADRRMYARKRERTMHAAPADPAIRPV